MQIINHLEQDFETKINKIVSNNSEINTKTNEQVLKILNLVKNDGDKAIIEICNKFDNANFKNPQDLLVSQKEIDESIDKINPELLQALKLSYQRILSYHKKQLPEDFIYEDDIGVTLGNRWQAIESICVYAPGGSAIYPSSILMSAVPAITAGVKNITATIPSNNGKIADVVLAACKICNINQVYKIGGTAAIAAFAYGTKTIAKVNKIVGPGNSYVALAKKHLFGTVGIDMIAGPTDILVISDDQSNPDWVAADMLSQLEHGSDSRAILIVDSLDFAQKCQKSIIELADKLSRKNIITESLKNCSIIIVKNITKQAADIANRIAPEHLEIMADNANIIAQKINNAGAIFLGRYTPEAIGDYIAGPSHTLPTMSSAKFSSGLSVFDFLKRISIISCNKESFKKLKKPTEILAQSEGFDGHKMSCQIRDI